MEHGKKKEEKDELITQFCLMFFLSLIVIGVSIFFIINAAEIKTGEGGDIGHFVGSALALVTFSIMLIAVCCNFWKLCNKQHHTESQPLLGPFPSNLGYPPIVSKNQSVQIEKPYLVSYKI